MYECPENYKTYCLYILEHVPVATRFYYGREGRLMRSYHAQEKRKILVQYTLSWERNPYDFVWKEISTGNRIWSNRTNKVNIYQYPFLNQIKRTKKIYSLCQLAFFLLSTKEISVVQNFLLNVNYFH